MAIALRSVMRSILPVRVRKLLVALRASVTLNAALEQLNCLAPGEVPSDDLLNALIRGWNNDNFVATPEYLRAVASACSQTELPVLECGSGLSTVICAAMSRRGPEVWTFEHHPAWRRKVSRAVRKIRGANVHLPRTPLRMYGEFDWYDATLRDLPAQFGVVVCDGPPGTTRGGRAGLLPVLGSRLAPGCLILMDDAHRAAEQSVIEHWKNSADMDVTLQPSGVRSFARIVLH